MTAKDALRVALALALWKSPGAAPAQQQSSEVGQWVLRAIAAHSSASGTAGRDVSGPEDVGMQGEAAAEAVGAPAGVHSGTAEGTKVSDVGRGAAAEQGGQAGDAFARQKQVESEQKAAAERERILRRKEEGDKAAAVEFSRSLPVAQVRVLAAAMSGAEQRASPVPPYVLSAFQERAGFV